MPLPVNKQESTSIVSQAAPVAPPLSTPPPPTSAIANERVGLPQSHSLIDSGTGNLVITGGQYHQAHGHCLVFNFNQGNPADSRSSSPGPPSNEIRNVNPAQISGTRIEVDHERSQVPPQSQEISFQRSNVIYERHLALKERGFPLWIPGPDRRLHKNYRRTGVRIGDVGIITPYGAFSFLFNICLPHNDPVNPRVLPEHFTPISPPIEATDISDFTVFENDSHLASASVKRSQTGTAISDIVFESSASEGAILTMPRGARSEDLANLTTFRKYAAANVANWYRFVNGPRGREAKNGEVRLVVGFDKTVSWGIATFQVANQTQQNGCRLKFGPSERDSASTYKWSENSGVADVRAGSNSNENDELRIDSDPPDVQFENQCLFVRTMNVNLEDDVWADIHSSSGSNLVDPRNSQYPHVKNYSDSNRPRSDSPGNSSNVSPSQGAQSGSQRRLQGIDITSDEKPPIFVSGPFEGITAHPSKVLNEYLLAKIPTAKMVITHDGDWSSVAQHDASLDPHEFVANILASQDICQENGVVFLQPKKIINEISEGFTSVNRAQVPEAAVVQGSPAHYVSPLMHDKPIQKSSHSDEGEEYVNEHTAGSISCTASQTSPSELPSQVEETLAVSPRLRIRVILVGNTGVGKSSLVSAVFGIVFNNSVLDNEDHDGTIDVAHDRVEKADINHEYQNPYVIVHDSMGFEPGSTEKSEIVRTFLRDRAEGNAELPEQVHAIWFCIEIPRMGSRLLQAEDEDLLEFAKELKIPVIVVLTKYDLLVSEHYRACSDISSLPDREVEAKKRAERVFSEVTKELKELKVPFAPVSTLKITRKEYGGTMLVELIQVTRDNLRKILKAGDVELRRELISDGNNAYRIHAASHEGRLVVVKTFEGPRAKQDWKVNVAFSEKCLHPNVLLMGGISDESSKSHFILFHGITSEQKMHWLIANALGTDLNTSVQLSMKAVKGIAAGLSYIISQEIPVMYAGTINNNLKWDNFDILSGYDNEPIIAFHLSSTQAISEDGSVSQNLDIIITESRGIEVLNGLCDQLFSEANSIQNILYDDSPERKFDVYDSESFPVATWELEEGTSNLSESEAISNPSRKPRREVWWLDLGATNHTLKSIRRRFEDRLNRFLLSPFNSLLRYIRSPKVNYLRRNLHQCPGYLREEITLTCDLSKSAIVSHTFPDLSERCSICHQLVQYTYSESNQQQQPATVLASSDTNNNQATLPLQHNKIGMLSGPSNQKDNSNRPKLPRACARCKKFKLKCETKTGTEPCNRCLNGGHECVRRNHPHHESERLKQSHSQAEQIRSLLLQERAASSARNKGNLPYLNTMITDPKKPLVLSPTVTASGPYFGSGSDSGTVQDENSDATANEVSDNWIVKRARQSLHYSGAFGTRGGAMPQRYLIRENYEESDFSGDEEFVDSDVSEELDDRYEDEEPNKDDMISEGPGGQRPLRPKSSVSSFGNSQVRKRSGDHSKPASLPVEASPFGLFGNLSLKSRSRAGSAERDDEDRTLDNTLGGQNRNF